MRADLIAHVKPTDTPRDVAKAATSLEAFFLRQVLGSVRGADEGNGVLGGGFAGSMFHEMLDEAIADSMAKSGGVGLGKMIANDLARGAKAAPGAAAGATHVPPAHPGAPSIKAVHVSRAQRSYCAASAKAVDKAPELASPIAARESSGFGSRIDPLDGKRRYHAGLDLAAPGGSKVGAAGAGVVIVAGSAGSYGNLVVVDHGGGLETRYAHLERATVKPGDRVEAGQELGLVGETGRATGPHLHFEVRREGLAVDPKRVLAMAPKFTR